MAEENNGAAANGNASNVKASNTNEAPAAPNIQVMVQYTKDFSFENPNAPMSLGGDVSQNSKINIVVNVEATPMADDHFEVVLQLEASAKDGEKVIFNAELYFGGVFKLHNCPPDTVHPMVMIECPRILFPFARRIISDAIRDGGFPPLMIDPVDFTQLYRDSIVANVEQSKAAEAAKTAKETKQ
ncbi:MAG: protein-export chaperone SecB [Hyphomicrobiales bacterium]|nr:MAG: protein-export chaperone SecB [Hyphomicrobiales bacterium]